MNGKIMHVESHQIRRIVEIFRLNNLMFFNSWKKRDNYVHQLVLYYIWVALLHERKSPLSRLGFGPSNIHDLLLNWIFLFISLKLLVILLKKCNFCSYKVKTKRPHLFLLLRHFFRVEQL